MTEQRMSDRQPLEATQLSVVDVESGVEFDGEAVNHSDRGLFFHATMEPPVGAELQVTMSGQKSRVRVLRVEPRRDGFDVAGLIRRR